MTRNAVVGLVVAGIALVVVAVVVFGGNSAPRDPMTGATEFDIPTQDPALVAEGEVLYQANCAACHGVDLRGTAAGPSQLSVIYQPGHHPDDAYVLAALNGVRAHHWSFGDMPPVPGLSREDMDRIVAYVREVQRIEGFEAYPP
jgi:mono/diheme cytochrome c family protein